MVSQFNGVHVHKLNLLTVIFIILTRCLLAQNLVPNPGFECGKDDCEPGLDPFRYYELACIWTSPQNGTPDAYSTKILNPACFASMPYAGIDRNADQIHAGSQLPRTGDRFAGIFTYDDGIQPCYREYLQVKLTEALEPGQLYCAKMYVSRAEFMAYATNNLGMYFGSMYTHDVPNHCTISVVPQIVHKSVITEYKDWVEISGVFRATAPDEYLIVGNFASDSATIKQYIGSLIPQGYKSGAYYFIDDVSVEKISTQVTITGDTLICAGDGATLVLKETFDFVSWRTLQDSITLLGSGNEFHASPQETTDYLMKATKCGRDIKGTFRVKVNPVPHVDLGRDTVICPHEQYVLHAGTEGTYLWQDNSTGESFTVTEAANYSVIVTNSFNCTSVGIVKVSIGAPPVVNLGKDTLVCKEFYPLKAGNIGDFLWSTGSVAGTITPERAGTYWVLVKNQCGVAYDTIRINSANDVFIPNVLTLNGDALNETFRVSGIGPTYKVSLKVINRWGDQVYSNSDYKNNWPAPATWPDADLFYYTLSLDGCRSLKGWIRLEK